MGFAMGIDRAIHTPDLCHRFGGHVKFSRIRFGKGLCVAIQRNLLAVNLFRGGITIGAQLMWQINHKARITPRRSGPDACGF